MIRVPRIGASDRPISHSLVQRLYVILTARYGLSELYLYPFQEVVGIFFDLSKFRKQNRAGFRRLIKVM